MNRLFRRLSLSAKLTLLALIPLLLLIYFAIQIYREKSEKISILKDYLARTQQSAEVSTLIDELQVERRYSFGNVINREWKTELIVQRPRTDTALRRILNRDELRNAAEYTFLDSLNNFRIRIDEGKATPTMVLNFYSNAIFRLNTLNLVSAGNRYLSPVKGELQGQKLLSEMITYLGIIRAYIYYSLHSGNNAEETAASIRSTFGIYQTYQREFELKASPVDVASFKKLAAENHLNTSFRYIHTLIDSGSFEKTYSPDQWWTVSANGVDELKQLQRNVVQKAYDGIQKVVESERSTRDRTLFFLVLIIFLVVAIVLFTIMVISRSLKELNEAAVKISRGATGIEVKEESNDVIGSLARSIRRIDENNKMLAEAAFAIGSGNFDVTVKPRSEEDVLGNAVKSMKKDLALYARENEEKIWNHNGMARMNEAIRGEKELHQLSTDMLHALVSYTGGSLGLLYVRHSEFLEYSAGFAVDNSLGIPKRIGMGETLIGQSAQRKEKMELNEIPENFIRIRSGVAEGPPKYLIILPLIHNDYVEGVIEIGSLLPFTPAIVNFLEQVSRSMAISLQGAKSRQRMQELLEQTQVQAEELQVQHSELENINAELEAQSEKLQASEEELRVQQEELLQANSELEERSRLLEERNQIIVEKNLDIQQKAETLEQTTRYKSEFMANMSHELRTPLNSVLLLSRLLSENNEKNLTAEQIEYANVIQSSGRGLLSLIDEILDLSKIEAGKMELEYHPVFLQEIVQDLKSVFEPMVKEKGLELNITMENDLPSRIETDKMRLEQILKNLLSNALKFTAKGSISLEIRKSKEQENYLVFGVRDTGIGIAEDKLGPIFEAFRQADGSTRRKYGGTGLGLSISREFTRLLGGDINASSEIGKGSVFTVTIPVNRQVAVIKPAKEETPETVVDTPIPVIQERSNLREEKIPASLPDDRKLIDENDKIILIIEDDTTFARTLLDYTHKKGYKGLVAVRGDEGIALAQQYRPSGILLDLRLPVKDGWEVMEELKSNPATRHIPVHIMSSLDARKESLVKGAVDFINKPVLLDQMQEVFNKIEHVLNREHKKVLILEENPRHAKALAYFLENFNIATTISGSITKGVEDLQQDKADCVILDMGIPDQQAYETLEAVKKTNGLENLPVIIFTGRSLSKQEEQRIKQYADSIVIKTAHSYQRILDEVSLFLHLVEENNSKEKPPKYRRLGVLNEVLAGKKILIVDDDVRNIFSLTRTLEIHQMQVITAVDGKEALKLLDEHPDTQAVLMDIMMPEMDGYEAMQKIREQIRFRQLPVIALTAKAMTGDREKCIKAGASDYISKPVDIDQLLSLLRVWLYDKNI